MKSTPRVPVAMRCARSVQTVASPTAALMPTGSPIAAAMDSTKSSSASAFPKALCAAGLTQSDLIDHSFIEFPEDLKPNRSPQSRPRP